jgi:hypothetical protein
MHFAYVAMLPLFDQKFATDLIFAWRRMRKILFVKQPSASFCSIKPKVNPVT